MSFMDGPLLEWLESSLLAVQVVYFGSKWYWRKSLILFWPHTTSWQQQRQHQWCNNSKPKPSQAKPSQDKNWLTSKLQQVESCSWLEEDRSTYLLTYRYVHLYRFVFGIVRNQSHQSIMDVVMNERTAELYTHWVEKISELATYGETDIVPIPQ